MKIPSAFKFAEAQTKRLAEVLKDYDSDTFPARKMTAEQLDKLTAAAVNVAFQNFLFRLDGVTLNQLWQENVK